MSFTPSSLITIINSKLKELFAEHAVNSQRTKNKQMVNCYQYIDEFVQNGGKRVRPILCLLCYLATCPLSSTSDQIPNDVIECAVAIELIHQSSLVHDDIMDEDDLRRGNPTVWKRFEKAISMNAELSSHQLRLFSSNAAQLSASLAIIAGNILYCEGCKLASKYPDRITAILESYRIVNNGQLMDLCPQCFPPTEQITSDLLREMANDYIEMVRRKTSCLLMLPATIGCLCSNASSQQRTVLENALEFAAISFQLFDDVMDISSDCNKGNTLGSDLLQEKFTPLILITIERLSSEEREEFLTKFRSPKTNESLHSLIETIEKTGAKEETIQLSGFLVQNALFLLDGKPMVEAPVLKTDHVLSFLYSLKPCSHFSECASLPQPSVTQINKCEFHQPAITVLKELVNSFVNRKV